MWHAPAGSVVDASRHGVFREHSKVEAFDEFPADCVLCIFVHSCLMGAGQAQIQRGLAAPQCHECSSPSTKGYLQLMTGCWQLDLYTYPNGQCPPQTSRVKRDESREKSPLTREN